MNLSPLGALGMAYRINPAFDRWPEEARLVGLILSSFGELEFTVCDSADVAIARERFSFFKALYRLRSTSSRLDVADAMMGPIYAKNGLAEVYENAIGMVRHSLVIRNQYSHCNWADHPADGLFFADVQSSARNKNFEHFYKHVDLTLLQLQYDFFALTLEWLRYADNQLGQKTGGNLGGLVWPIPLGSILPPLHNPPSAHVPPFLDRAHREAHLKRALELEGRDQPREREPSVLRLTREEWAAKDAKEAREGRSGSSEK
jgi:hypothetical protein